MGGPENGLDGWSLVSYELNERTGVGRARYERDVPGQLVTQVAHREWEGRSIPRREDALR